MKLAEPILFPQPQDCSATADFDVIGVRTQAQNSKRFAILLARKTKLNHATTRVAGWPFFHKHQGAVPDASNSSRICLSLKVSMHCQNPLYRGDQTLPS